MESSIIHYIHDVFAERGEKMNKSFKRLSIFVLALTLMCTMHTAGAMVVYVNDTGGNPGTTIYVPINMSDASDVGAMDISLTYNSDVLSPTGIVTTGDLTAGALVINETTIYVDPVTDKETISEGDNQTVMQYGALAHNTTATSGVVNISIICNSEPPVGFNGAGSVAVVRFMVTGTGSSPLNLCAAAYNVSAPIPNATDPTKTDGYEPICTTTENGTFTVTGDETATIVSIESVGAPMGCETTVQIMAHNVTDLKWFGIVLDYDPAIVNATGAVNSPNFSDDFMGTSLNDFSHASEGYVLLGSNPSTATPQSGTDVLLTTVTLKAVGSSGTSVLGLTITTLKNVTGDVSATVSNGTFTITELASVDTSPDTADLAVGETQQFTATCYDTSGNPISGCTLTWECDNPSVGTINSTTGLFTASGVGTATVTVTATYGVTKTDTAVVNVTLQKNGNIDGEGDVDFDDAIYLACYTLYGEVYYPLYADGDVDSSGDVNFDDAIYLACYTLYGEAYYPLYPPI